MDFIKDLFKNNKSSKKRKFRKSKIRYKNKERVDQQESNINLFNANVSSLNIFACS